MSSPPSEATPVPATAPDAATAPERPALTPLTLRQGAAVLAPHLREQRATIAVAVLLSLVAAASSLAQPLLVGRVISTVSEGSALGGVVLAVVAVLVAGTVVGAVQQYLLQRAGEGVVLGVRRRLVDRLLRITVAERDARLSGDLLSRVGSDTTALASVVSSGLFDVVSVALTAVGALVLMGVIDLLLLGVTVLAVGTGTVVGVTMSRRLAPLDLATQQRVGAMSAAVARVLSAVRTVRASGATERELVGVVAAAEDARRVAVHAARVRAMISPVTGIAVQGAFVGVLGLGGYRVASGDITVAQLVSFILLLFTLVFPLGQLLRVWSVLQTGLAALTRIEEVLVLEVEDDTDPAPGGTPTAARPGAPSGVPSPTRAVVAPRAAPEGGVAGEPPALELDRVAFSYADGTAALHEVSFAVPRGTRTALVGPSGGGKSTVLSLVERFYDPTSGVVRLGGTDVRDMPRAGLRARLAYVEQDAPVLAGTLRSNLLLAAPAATEADLARVLESVGLTEIGTRSAEGLDVQVGESGVLLSGGQRQRLAIARSLLAEPELLLLDEPTASLDARNEALLRDALAVAAASRTLVVVAHRLSTVVDSDQIVVIEAGRVRAAGTHGELLEVDALYRELATTQLLV